MLKRTFQPCPQTSNLLPLKTKETKIPSTEFVSSKNADYSRQKTDENEHIFYFEHGIIFNVKMLFQPSSNYKTNGKINCFDIFAFFIFVISRKAKQHKN